MKPITFFVPGDPKAQPRSRSFVLRGRGGRPILSKAGEPIIRVHDPGTAENWKSQIAEHAKPFIPFKLPMFPANNDDGTFNAVSVHLDFSFQRPQTHFRSNGSLKQWAPAWNASRMDCDNLAKAVLDCLTVIGFWKDDGIVCSLHVMKHYCAIGEQSGCNIEIEPLESKLERTHYPEAQTALKI